MGLKETNLIPSKKVFRALGGSTLINQWWLPVQFSVGEMSTKQASYIDKLYFSKAPSIYVGVLAHHVPTPMSLTTQREVNWMIYDHRAAVCLPNMERKQSTNFQLPIRPEELPIQANKENVENLGKKGLLEQFANLAFKTDEQFPAMYGKPTDNLSAAPCRILVDLQLDLHPSTCVSDQWQVNQYLIGITVTLMFHSCLKFSSKAKVLASYRIIWCLLGGPLLL